jgi:hypothetical protein
MDTQGLQLDQAPPLSIPVSFFRMVPLFMGAAGALLAWRGAALVTSPWAPSTIGLTHLGTLGLLGCAMLGALYQMIPVVAGHPVPAVRLAWATLGGWVLGALGLVGGLTFDLPWLVQAGRAALGLAVLLVGVPVAVALVRSKAEPAVRFGFVLALTSLVGLVVVGVLMASGHAGGAFLASRPQALVAHLCLGAFGWVGGLITTVSWQVLPMFYLAPAIPARWQRLVTSGLALGALGPAIGWAMGLDRPLLLALALPGALTAWGLHPFLMLRAIQRRGRPRPDPSLTAWKASAALALLGLPLAAVAAEVESSRPAMVLAWLLIWGQGGLLITGMLSRILPFLVWFHRWSGRVGKERVPSMRSLLPDPLVNASLRAHAVTLVLGVLAFGTGHDALARLAGLGVLVTAALLARMIARPLQSGREGEAPAARATR